MTARMSAFVPTIALLWITSGCAGHSVKYVPFVKCRIGPTERAIAIDGTIDEARAAFERAQLPHNTWREKCALMIEGSTALTSQLGSGDYIIIGEVYGGGNAYANQFTLTNALCKRAARQGGDVVLVFRRDVTERPFVYSTPAYSTTDANATAYAYGNQAVAYGTSNTTYYPGHTYSGVLYFPNANGLVLKHVPGAGAERKQLLELDEAALASVIPQYQAIAARSDLSWEEACALKLKAFEAAKKAPRQ